MASLVLSQVSIHGVTFSTLLQSLISGERNVDGILLGLVKTQTTSNFQDDDSGMAVDVKLSVC